MASEKHGSKKLSGRRCIDPTRQSLDPAHLGGWSSVHGDVRGDRRNPNKGRSLEVVGGFLQEERGGCPVARGEEVASVGNEIMRSSDAGKYAADDLVRFSEILEKRGG